MSTPNPKDPKKPADGARPKIPTATGAKPPPKSPKPVASGGKPPEKKPPKKENAWAAEAGTRKIGQIMVDLGFIDESQLWDILEEARTNGLRVGQTALSRGLITEDQLLQAVAEQHNLKVVNLEEEKPTPQAIGMVQQTM